MDSAEPQMTDFLLPPKPDPKTPVSVRMPNALKAKLQWVVELWRTQARASGADEGTIEAIDFPYVLLRLLAGRTDEELAQWGGFPVTPEQQAAQTKAIVAATKKQHR